MSLVLSVTYRTCQSLHGYPQRTLRCSLHSSLNDRQHPEKPHRLVLCEGHRDPEGSSLAMIHQDNLHSNKGNIITILIIIICISFSSLPVAHEAVTS